MSASGESEVHSVESELGGLCTFVDETNQWIDQTLATLNWTREHVLKVTSYLFCVATTYLTLYCLLVLNLKHAI